MIKTTMGELLDTELAGVDTEGHHIYMVRDGDTIFYVGKSRCPVSRLLGHCGRGDWTFDGVSQLGRLIRCNWPVSRFWQVELLTVSDCNAYSVENAEDRLIFELAPHFNRIGKRRSSGPLPRRYKDPRPDIISVCIREES